MPTTGPILTIADIVNSRAHIPGLRRGIQTRIERAMAAANPLPLILASVAAVTPTIAIVAPRSLAVLLPVAAVAAVIARWRQGRFALPSWALITLITLFLAWAAMTALWTPDVPLAWRAWRGIVGLSVAGLLLLGLAQRLEEAGRAKVGMALLIGVGIALAIFCVEFASALLLPRSVTAMINGKPQFSEAVFNRAAVTIVLLLWPAAYVLAQRRGLIAALALLIAAGLVLSRFDSMAAGLGLLAGAIVWLLASWRPRGTALGLAVVLIVGTALAPVVPRTAFVGTLAERRDISGSISHRAEIWRFVADSIVERPILGWGLNISRELAGGDQDAATVPGKRLPLHPHNALLQWWLELGAIGAALGLAVLLFAIRAAATIASSDRGAAAAALALIASGVLMAAVSYGIWQSWWMAALWLAAILMAGVTKITPSTR